MNDEARSIAFYACFDGQETDSHHFGYWKHCMEKLFTAHPAWQSYSSYIDTCQATLCLERPQFRQLMNACDDGYFDLLVVNKMSSFSGTSSGVIETTRRLSNRQSSVPIYFLHEELATEQGNISMLSYHAIMLDYMESYRIREQEKNAAYENWIAEAKRSCEKADG